MGKSYMCLGKYFIFHLGMELLLSRLESLIKVMGLGELIYIIYPTIIGIPTLFYFTRPKVKEQFKGEEIANA